MQETTEQITQKRMEEFNKKQGEEFAKKVKNNLSLTDLTKTTSSSYTVYSKDKLRTALSNPLTKTNQKTLKELSQYLYHLNFQLRKIIGYFADQIDLNKYIVVPSVSMSDDIDAEKILKNYDAVCTQIKKMNLETILGDAKVTAWREDCVYLYFNYDQGEENVFDFMAQIMNADYCKVSSQNYDSTFNYAFDFSFFSGANSVYLDMWDSEFKKKYNVYQKDSTLRWQELDSNKAVCFKINSDQPDRVIPPLASIFESAIDAIDLRSLISVKDQLSVYKLLVAKIETLKSSNQPDDFAVDLDLCLEFYNKIAAVLPDWCGIVLAPYSLDYVNMGTDATQDNDRLEQSISNIYSNVGGVILDNKSVRNASGINAALTADNLLAKKRLLGQIEAWANRMMNFLIPNNGMNIQFIKEYNPYNRNELIKQYKEAATLGLPGTKTIYASLIGISPKDLYSMQILENDMLHLTDNWIPLQSTYTQSGNSDTGGAPEKDPDELSDEGQDTKDGEKNKA